MSKRIPFMVNPSGKRAGQRVVATYRGVPIEFDGGGYVVDMKSASGGNFYSPRMKSVASARNFIGRALAKGATVKKNPRRRARKSVVRRRRPAARSRSVTKRKASVPAWVRAKGFSSWSSYMESIRPGGTVARKRRRSAPKSRRRRRRNPVSAVTRANPRRRRRRNPLGGRGGMLSGIPQMAMQGAIGAGQVIVGKGVARLIRGKFNLEGNTTTGSIVEVGIGLAGAIAMRRKYPRFAERFLIGAMIAPLETIAKQSNIPYLSTALGDEGQLPLIAGEDVVNIGGEYYPTALASGLSGEYMPHNMGGEEVPIQ